MSRSFTISPLATVDPALRGAITLNAMLDDPGLVVITHDILDGAVRRTVADRTGLIESDVTALDHACLGCAIRESMVPALASVHAMGRWQRAIIALPVTADPAPMVRSLDAEMRRRGTLAGASYGGTIAAFDAAGLAHVAFSDTYLDELELHLNEEDERVMSEAVAPIIAIADTVALCSEGTVPEVSEAVADHLRGRGSTVTRCAAHEVSVRSFMDEQSSVTAALARVDPSQPHAPEAADRAGVWTLSLSSPMPFHPGRLRANVRAIADHPVRSRGHFWIPARTEAVCVWDGAGRQLAVGEGSQWPNSRRGTHIVVTGMGDEREVIRRAYEDSLCTDVSDQLEAMDDAMEDWFGSA